MNLTTTGNTRSVGVVETKQPLRFPLTNISNSQFREDRAFSNAALAGQTPYQGMLTPRIRYFCESLNIRLCTRYLIAIVLSVIYFLIPSTFSIHAQAPANLSDEFIFIGISSDGTQRLAWGDIDGDGDLDLAVANGGTGLQGAPNQVYENDDGKFSTAPIWESTDALDSRSLALGDWDGDGDLDLAVANFNGPNQVFENQHGVFDTVPAWTSPDALNTTGLSWGDMDGDGDLDLAFAHLSNSSIHENPDIPECETAPKDQIFENLGGTLGSAPIWESADHACSYNIVWSDYDADGDLDLTTAMYPRSRVYQNEGGVVSTTPIWESSMDSQTFDVAWGDWDGDGDLDLALANGSSGFDRIYENTDRQLGNAPVWESPYAETTTNLAWGDYDSDGDLDLATATWYSSAGIFENNGAGLNTGQSWWLNEMLPANQVTFNDFDGDGDLDLAFAVSGTRSAENRIYINRSSPVEKAAAWSSNAPNNTNGIAWGDVDMDGDLDMAVANNGQPAMVYENVSGTMSISPTWQSDLIMTSVSAAWGDVDSDGDLDLAVGNYEANQLYLNDGGRLQTMPSWESADAKQTRVLAWGDVDGDKDLDLAIGNTGDVNQLFINENGQLNSEPVWQSENPLNTYGAAWGDWDNDGDLDLAFGNLDAENQVYENINGQLAYNPEEGVGWRSIDQKASTSIAWGDVDGDSDLDLAIGNDGNVNQLFENVDGMLSSEPIWESTGDASKTLGIAWGDWNGDGDLDLAAANIEGPIQVYENKEQQLSSTVVWNSNTLSRTVSLVWVDWDSDGDADLSAGNFAAPNLIFENHSTGQQGLVNDPPSIRLTVPPPAVAGEQYASATVLDAPVIDIPFTLFDAESDPVGELKAWYSPNGGGRWLPALSASETALTNLATSPEGVEHIFTWDVLGSGFFGRSDNVRFRLELLDQTSSAEDGQFRYVHKTASSAQRPKRSATTFPFRVQGTSVMVESNHSGTVAPVQDAIVFRLPTDPSIPTALLSDSSDTPYVTDHRGRLQGSGEVQIGDALVAMQPVSITEYMPITISNSIDLYFTSAAPTTEGLEAHTVAEAGQQLLTVSRENPLLLFNLDISLEWDARNNPEYMAELERDLLRTSEVLYDLTDGQAALGNVWIYHNKGRWLDAHIVIHATNSLRPNASLGGIVNYAIDDTILKPTEVFTSTPTTIPNAYLPGQIRIGSRWNRFGNKEGSQGEDWPRVLAHELGHYLFFQLDNYLGISENGLLTEVNCPNSVMTDPYVDGYSEFLHEWSDECLSTVAYKTTGRYDWETIRTFYPMLKEPAKQKDGPNYGPTNLPLAVTDIRFVGPLTPTQTLASPFFSLTDAIGQPLVLDDGKTHGYLYTTQGTEDPTDDGIIALGSPRRDQIFARGAAPGDRICIFGQQTDTTRLGCLQEVGSSESNIVVEEVAGWSPSITVTPINSRTFTVTVDGVDVSNLSAQIFPADGPASLEVALTRSATGELFEQVIATEFPTFVGYIRIFVPGSQPYLEALTELSLGPSWLGSYREWDGRDSGWDGRYRGWDGQYHDWYGRYRGWDGRYRGWDGRYRGWDGRYRGWDGRYRGWDAPVHSTDGQVTLFNVANVLDDNTTYQIQTLLTQPNLPSWLTPIGQAYRLVSSKPAETSSIVFQYLERNVPPGEEQNLQVYYSVNGDEPWIALETEQDTHRNFAAASTRGNGVYALLVTRKLGYPFVEGWNLFGYPIQDARPITDALASIEDKYSMVYRWETDPAPHWEFYVPNLGGVPPALHPLMTSLTHLSHGKGYWIKTTESVTPAFGVTTGNDEIRAAQLHNNDPPPPATYYGWITPTESFTPRVGMTVRGHIDGANCGDAGVQEIDGRLAYVLHVRQDICDVHGKTVQFAINGQLLDADRDWDNSEVWFHPLTAVMFSAAEPEPETQQPQNIFLYLPFMQ